MITISIDRGPKESMTVLSCNEVEVITHTNPELESYKKELKDNKEYTGDLARLKGVLIIPKGTKSVTKYIDTADRVKIFSAGALVKEM